MSRATPDLRYGDIVVGHIAAMDGPKRLLCRIWALLDANATAGFKERRRYYVLVPLNEKDADDELVFLYHVGRNRLSFQWGSLPEDDRYLVVSESGITPAYGENMKKLFKSDGLCPRCGDEGEWKALALFCKWHGMFL